MFLKQICGVQTQMNNCKVLQTILQHVRFYQLLTLLFCNTGGLHYLYRILGTRKESYGKIRLDTNKG